MAIVSRRPADWSFHALSAAGPLSPEDLRLVERLLGAPERNPAGAWLQQEGDRVAGSLLIVAGWAAQARVLADGRRQIGRILVSGDIAGLAHRGAGLPMGVVALTDVVTADLTTVRGLVETGRAPGLTRAWRALQAEEQANALAHIMRLGRFTAYERTGHLLLELYERLAAAGLTSGQSMPMPLTQEMLADCLGLSVVHLNRMLQQLRRDRLISADPRKVGFLDLQRLADQSHYQLRPEAARRGGPRVH